MASAVLANRNNEPSWPTSKRNGGGGGGGGGAFMARVPFSNPKSKPNMKKRKINVEINNFHQMGEELANVTTLSPSDDGSSIDRHHGSSNSEYNQYVSFNIASCSGRDLVELKKRLLGELEQVRRIKNRIESGDIGFGPNYLKKSSKSKGINKRPKPLPSLGRDLQVSNLFEVGNLMKTCSQILNKLMKQKYGLIFNKPVDVVGLGLHDYHDIVKHPMDLGTVKSKLAKNSYDSPLDFADDVRLTFNNAMMYNPKGHDVHVLAEQWLVKFEELFRPVSDKLGEPKQPDLYDEELQASSWNHVEQVEKVNFNSNGSKLEEVRVPSSSSKPPSIQSPVKTPSPVRAPQVKPVRQPKPKAKDPNKREMSLEEKHRLGVGLQGLPPEKMDQVIQIVKKRSGHLRQDGDEIELDIEAVDTETLWELDRLVTNWKKMMSKVKRQALFNNNANADLSKANELSSANETNEVKTEAKKLRKGDVGEEDVDIGDETMPMGGFPPVEIERDAAAHASSSSDSSSSSGSDDSSSSSGSDSDGSSSDSDSDGDGQS